jgi:hypothetical protein
VVKDVLWWIMNTAAGVLSILFLVLGIDLCRASYNLAHPHHFILTFFASNFIILISAVFLAAVVARGVVRFRHSKPDSDV